MKRRGAYNPMAPIYAGVSSRDVNEIWAMLFAEPDDGLACDEETSARLEAASEAARNGGRVCRGCDGRGCGDCEMRGWL